jgi:hypothetical protein
VLRPGVGHGPTLRPRACPADHASARRAPGAVRCRPRGRPHTARRLGHAAAPRDRQNGPCEICHTGLGARMAA